MITWPESLIPEVAQRRCIIVLGAGASAACQTVDRRHPPDWKELLIGRLLPKVADLGDREQAARLIEKEQYLDAAQIIVDKVLSPDFNQVIRREFQEPHFVPSRLHELILSLDPKIVITTNYDEIYEKYSQRGEAENAYNASTYYDSQAIDDIRSTRRLILKVHGSVTQPARVVLTRSQYFKARREGRAFYEILDALVLTNTLLFVGSGLSDPDIQLLLENANIAAPSTHPHYAVVESGRHPSITAAIRATHNLALLEYEAGRHDQVVESLEDLNEQVQQYREKYPF